MLQAMRDVYHYFQIYYNHSSILYLYILCMVVLCFLGKEKRKLIVYPSLLITFVIANPLMYKYIWTKLIGNTIWRMLWMIPVVPVVVCTLILVINKINRKYISVSITLAFMALIVLSNRRIYSMNTHVGVDNAYKLPDSTVHICNYLIDEENGGDVNVIMPASIYCYARQYDSRIHQLYGRDAQHYMAYDLLSEDVNEIASNLLATEPDMENVARVAKENNCEYIVCDVYNNVDNDLMETNGYSYINNIEGYKIYKLMVR